jgi:hypothetical protein
MTFAADPGRPVSHSDHPSHAITRSRAGLSDVTGPLLSPQRRRRASHVVPGAGRAIMGGHPVRHVPPPVIDADDPGGCDGTVAGVQPDHQLGAPGLAPVSGALPAEPDVESRVPTPGCPRGGVPRRRRPAHRPQWRGQPRAGRAQSPAAGRQVPQPANPECPGPAVQTGTARPARPRPARPARPRPRAGETAARASPGARRARTRRPPAAGRRTSGCGRRRPGRSAGRAASTWTGGRCPAGRPRAPGRRGASSRRWSACSPCAERS